MEQRKTVGRRQSGTELPPRAIQAEARALGDPSRHRIFRHIAEAPEAVDVAELTDLLGVNHNAVRQHLEILKDAHLVEVQVERRSRRGRPRLLYRLNPEAAGSWDTDGPYRRLAALLSEVVRTGATPRQVGRLEGHRRAQRPRPSRTLEALWQDMLSGGFRPTVMPSSSGCDFEIRRCPFADVAVTNPTAVCQLHLGLAEGIAEASAEGASVELTARDPHLAGCRLSVRLPAEPA